VALIFIFLIFTQKYVYPPPPYKFAQLKYLTYVLLAGFVFLSFACSPQILEEPNNVEIVSKAVSDARAKAVMTEMSALTDEFLKTNGNITAKNIRDFEEYIKTNGSQDLRQMLPHLMIAEKQKKAIKSFDPLVSTKRVPEKQRITTPLVKDNDPKLNFTQGPDVTIGNITGPTQIFLNPWETIYTGLIGTVTYILTYNPPSAVVADNIQGRMFINNLQTPPQTGFFQNTFGYNYATYGSYGGKNAVFVTFGMPTWVVPPGDVFYPQGSLQWAIYEYIRSFVPVKSYVGAQSSITITLSFLGSSGTITTSMIGQAP
jgi:hypothetical protein